MTKPQTTKEAPRIDLPKLMASEKLKLPATTTRVSMSWEELQRLADASYKIGFNACDCGR